MPGRGSLYDRPDRFLDAWTVTVVVGCTGTVCSPPAVATPAVPADSFGSDVSHSLFAPPAYGTGIGSC